MPRKARLNVPGALYHIMSRCLPVYQLFSDDEDREEFISILSENIARTGCRCYAWVLMDNHYHLVLRSAGEELWRLMKPLQMRYALYHGRKTGRRGPLFMDRYKSIVTQDQNYLLELIRYVHLNPVRAGVCRNLTELKRYRWSGHRNLMLGVKNGFQDLQSVLRRFGKDGQTARQRYVEFLRAGIAQSAADTDDLVQMIRKSNEGSEAGRQAGSWVIGDPDFVADVLSKAETDRLRISRFEREGSDLATIAEQVCGIFKVDATLLRTRHRGGAVSDARKVFAYRACRIYRAPVAKVREFLGVGGAAVSAMAAKGKLPAEKYGLAK